MKKLRSASGIARLFAAGLVAAALAGCARPPAGSEKGGRLSVVDILGFAADAPGFARAVAPRPFDFPADHGPHPAFRSEWWYFTGNLSDPAGRRFGYQVTFFRNALVPEAPPRASRWASRDVQMAHFAVTDARAGRIHPFERLSRAALGLAGARAEPFRVWIEDWSAEGGPEGSPLRLRLAEEGVAIDLVLEPAKPLVLQGEAGLSRKGLEPGNASYYYSYTRLATAGRLEIAGESWTVGGASWMDREWSTSALEEGQVGWDWFALQLDDGRELMCYRVRGADGGTHPASAGVLVAADGSAERLAAGDFRLEELERWRSDRSGVEYPSRWRLLLPEHGIELEIEPVIADQELRLSVVYWEGAVDVRGSDPAGRLTGRGYVELTGYVAARGG